jgi:putative transposase
MLCVVDEFMHACLAIGVKRKLKPADVTETLADIILLRRALPEFMRSDNGPEFIAKALRIWSGEIGVKTASIEKGSPWDLRG